MSFPLSLHSVYLGKVDFYYACNIVRVSLYSQI